MKLSEISRCFQGVVPSIIASSDAKGMPNVTYVSQVHYLDEQQVALSCQFFNKTRRNLDENPFCTAEIYDPVTYQSYRLRLKYLRSEKSGPLFDLMSMRIDAIASHTGMTGIFRLIAADIFEVLKAEKVEGFLVDNPAPTPAPELTLGGLRTEMRGLQWISERINRAEDLETLLAAALDALDVYFGFQHTIVLFNEESCGRLVTVACRGYGGGGVGSEVVHGEGLIGMVAQQKKVLRMSALDAGLRYGRAIRREMLQQKGGSARPEIPMPGLSDVQSALVMPLLVGEDRLIGVLAAESRDPLAFGEWDEAYLGVIGNQIALGIDRILERGAEQEADTPAPAPTPTPARPRLGPKRTLTYYAEDETVFVDGDYLIRNVPARILWKLLGDWKASGRTDFTNRELRLDSSLGLPEVKDNLESRLILLRHRLEEKTPGVRIVPTGRGRFALVVDADVEMVTR